MNEARSSAHRTSGAEAVDSRLKVNLEITDPDVLAEIVTHAEGPDRDGFCLCALRLGVLSLRQARGEVDTQTLRRAGERLVADMRAILLEHGSKVTHAVTTSLAQYLDPASGVLPQRLERLVTKDGELDGILARHLAGDTSQLAQMLTRHFGEQSPLFRILSPKQSDGILAALTDSVERALAQQRDTVLYQFSLDHADSALSRLVRGLTDTNGRLKEDFKRDLTTAVKEFSLDEPNSALSRLVSQVDRAQKSIADQFSLDLENSSLSRLKRELMAMLDRLDADQKRFQAEVLTSLAVFQTRRQEAARSPRHGSDFEGVVADTLGAEVRRLGDIFAHVGNTTGKIKHCKLGDFLAELGAETPAPGEKIVAEAKAAAGFDVPRALDALNTARENRGAQVGIFVLAKNYAPDTQEALARYGENIIVLWDEKDSGTDVYLRAAYSLARYMVVRRCRDDEQAAADLSVMDDAVAEIARKAKALDDITTLTQTINSNSSKIIDRARAIREILERQVDILSQHIGALRRRAR
jgi:hypothetical protein